jgi:hypothetical protein
MCHNGSDEVLGEELHPCRAEFLLVLAGAVAAGAIALAAGALYARRQWLG